MLLPYQYTLLKRALMYKQTDIFEKQVDLPIYQAFTPTTFVVPEYPTTAVDAYLFSGLAAEAGEVVGNYAKYVRGDFDKRELASRTHKELGDVLYFVSQISNEFDFNIEDILRDNMTKLEDRMKKNKISGDGEVR